MEVTVKSEPFKGWKGITGLVIGVFLVALGLMPQNFSVSKITLGVICVFISGVKKTISLDESGLTERVSVWGIKKEKKSQWPLIESIEVDKKGADCFISARVSGKSYRFISSEDVAMVFTEIFHRRNSHAVT